MSGYEFVIELAPFVVALFGIVLSGITFFLNYRDRRLAPFREKHYSKRLEAYQEMLSKFGMLHVRVYSEVESGVSDRDTLEERIADYAFATIKYGLLLSERMILALDEYCTLLYANRSGDTSKAEFERLYRNVVKVAREDLGTGRLSEEVLALLAKDVKKFETEKQ